MKKFFNKVQTKANELAIRAKSTLDNAKAEGYIDTGVKIIIGVVVVEGHLVDREAVAFLKQHQSDARGEGRATAGNGHGIVFLGHDVLLILAACSIHPRTRPARFGIVT